jgi:hypothetical protein
MPGKPKGPKTTVFHIRLPEADYQTLQTRWHRHNPEDFHTFHAWLVNELHKLAEHCRGTASDTERFPPTVVMTSEESGVAVIDTAGTLATILEIDRDKAADLLRRKRVSLRNATDRSTTKRMAATLRPAIEKLNT